jgi:hypothetical protein
MGNQVGFEALTVSTTAVSVTKTTITPLVRAALFIVTKAAVRYRGDGTAPTSSTGAPLWPGQVLPLVGEGTIRNAQFIRQDSTDATVYCLAYDQVDIVGPISNGGLYEDDVAFTLGSPVNVIAALADDTAPDDIDEGDIGAVGMTLSRELHVTPKGRGAGAVKNLRVTSDGSSTTVKTAITAVSGSQLQLISIMVVWPSTVTQIAEVYFGTGANIGTDNTKAISSQRYDSDLTDMQFFISWPDGGGPISADSEQVAIRNGVSNADVVTYVFQYREVD